MAELKPCPKCGGRILANGMPIKITTSKILRPVMRVIGIMCVRCGHWKHSIRAWNRRTTIETNIYDKEETYPNCTVQVLTNTVTGEVSVGWWENGRD